MKRTVFCDLYKQTRNIDIDGSTQPKTLTIFALFRELLSLPKFQTILNAKPQVHSYTNPHSHVHIFL